MSEANPNCILRKSAKMASGGILCEVPQLPKVGHKIETMEFLDNLSKYFILILEPFEAPFGSDFHPKSEAKFDPFFSLENLC